MKLSSTPKILIIRFSSLGDVVLSSSILPALRQAYPKAQLTFLTKKPYDEVIALVPQLNNVLILMEGESLWSLASRLKKGKYDLVIDLHGNLRSALLRVLLWPLPFLKAPGERWKRQALVWFKYHSRQPIKSVVKRYADTLSSLAIRIEKPAPRLSLNGLSPKIREHFGIPQLSKPIIGLCLGSTHATKKWNVQAAAQCIQHLHRSHKASFVLVGKETDNIETLTQGNNVLNLLGKTSLMELAAVMSTFSVLLSMDSGPLHMAEALGVPVVSLFGPTVTDFGFAPLLSQSRVIEVPLPCRPCSLHGGDRCPLGHHRCMTEIKPDQVAQAVIRLLK